MKKFKCNGSNNGGYEDEEEEDEITGNSDWKMSQLRNSIKILSK